MADKIFGRDLGLFGPVEGENLREQRALRRVNPGLGGMFGRDLGVQQKDLGLFGTDPEDVDIREQKALRRVNPHLGKMFGRDLGGMFGRDLGPTDQTLFGGTGEPIRQSRPLARKPMVIRKNFQAVVGPLKMQIGEGPVRRKLRQFMQRKK